MQFNALKLFGVWKLHDAALSFDKHVTNVDHPCTFNTRALRRIRPLLTLEAAKAVAMSIAGSRFNYCNSLLYGKTERNLDRLQPVSYTHLTLPTIYSV